MKSFKKRGEKKGTKVFKPFPNFFPFSFLFSFSYQVPISRRKQETMESRVLDRLETLLNTNHTDSIKECLLAIVQSQETNPATARRALHLVLAVLEDQEGQDTSSFSDNLEIASYGLGAIVGLIQDLIDAGELSSAKLQSDKESTISEENSTLHLLKRACTLAVTTLYLKTSSSNATVIRVLSQFTSRRGNIDVNETWDKLLEEQIQRRWSFAIVLPCVTLISTLSSLNEEAAECVPENDMAPSLVICILRCVAFYSKKKQLRNGEVGEGINDGKVYRDEDCSPDIVEQVAEYAVLAVLYQTRLSSRAIALLQCGASIALRLLAKIILSYRKNKNKNSKQPTNGSSIASAACSALAHLLSSAKRDASTFRNVLVEKGNDLRFSILALESAPGDTVAAACYLLHSLFETHLDEASSTVLSGSAVASFVDECDIPCRILQMAASFSLESVTKDGEYALDDEQEIDAHAVQSPLLRDRYGADGEVREVEAVDAASSTLQMFFRCLARPVNATQEEENQKPISMPRNDSHFSVIVQHAPLWARATIELLLSVLFQGAAVEEYLLSRLQSRLTSFQTRHREEGQETCTLSSSSLLHSNDITSWEVAARQSSLQNVDGKGNGAEQGLFVTRGTVPAGTAIAVYGGEWHSGDGASDWWLSLPRGHPAEQYTTCFASSGAMLDGCPAALERCATAARIALDDLRSDNIDERGTHRHSSHSKIVAATKSSSDDECSEAPKSLEAFLDACMCLGHKANHPIKGTLPSLVFYEVSSAWFSDEVSFPLSGDIWNSFVVDLMSKEKVLGGSFLRALPIRSVHANGKETNSDHEIDRVMVLVTLRECHEGEELFVDYGIDNSPTTSLSSIPKPPEETDSEREGAGRGAVLPAPPKLSTQVPSWYVSPWAHLGLSSGEGNNNTRNQSWKIQGVSPPLSRKQRPLREESLTT